MHQPKKTRKTTDESDVTARLLNRDAAALEEVISRYQARIYHLAFSIVKNHHDAQEVAQDTLFAIYSKIGSFRRECSLFSWIYRITMNFAFMTLRRRRKELHISIDAPGNRDKECVLPVLCIADTGKRADEKILDLELMEMVFNSLAEQPDIYRQIFLMGIFNDHSNAEMGQRLHLSVAAVKSRLHRSRAFLRERLREVV